MCQTARLQMFTRQDYMEGRCDHHEYYMEIAREVGLDYTTSSELGRWRRALETDPHMNNIPLAYWDKIAMELGADAVVRRALKTRGDSFSLGTGVCLAKAAAIEAVRRSDDNQAD